MVLQQVQATRDADQALIENCYIKKQNQLEGQKA